MRAYCSIFRTRISVLFRYRVAAIVGMGAQFFWAFVKVMVLTAFYAQAVSPQPISLVQVITFIWIGQALVQLLPWTIDKDLAEEVRSGQIAYELVRPIDLYWVCFARSLALRFVPTFMRAIPLYLLATLFFGLPLPQSWWAGGAFATSVLIAFLLSAAMTNVVIITLFWTISGEGLLRLLPHTVLLFSGLVVPLPLFPNWLQPFMNIQPFRGMVDIPCRLYMGLIPTTEALFYLGFQLFWTLFFVVLGKWMLQKALRQFVIGGG